MRPPRTSSTSSAQIALLAGAAVGLAVLALASGCGGGTARAVDGPAPAPTRSASAVPARPALPPAEQSSIGALPRLGPSVVGPLRGNVDGATVPPLRLTLELPSDGAWRLRGESDGTDTQLLLPLVFPPETGKCIVRALGQGVTGRSRFRYQGRYTESLGYAVQFVEVSRTPVEFSREMPLQQIGRAKVRLRVMMGASTIGGGIERGTLQGEADVTIVQTGPQTRESDCGSSFRAAVGTPARGHIGSLGFEVVMARLEQFPTTDEGPGGWGLRLFNRRVEEGAALLPAGLRETRVTFVTGPGAGKCVALDSNAVISGPTPELQASRARVRFTQYQAPFDGAAGLARAEVLLDWQDGSKVEGIVDAIKVVPLALRGGPPPIAPKVVEGCE